MLHRRFDSTATAAVVDLELQRALDKFAGAPIRTYVPILAEREVAARLGRRTSARAAAEATVDHTDHFRTRQASPLRSHAVAPERGTPASSNQLAS